jgi:hypothetical protein
MRTLLALLVSAAAAACGSATSPTPHSSMLNPAYVDSVRRANCVGGGNAACELSGVFMWAMSAGAMPSYISVQTRTSAAAHWWAIVAATYRPVGQNGRVDTTEAIVVVPDTTFTSGAIIHHSPGGPLFGGADVYVDNAEIGGADVNGSSAVARVAEQCTAVTGPGITFVPPFLLSECHEAVFLISFDFNLGGLNGEAVGQRINGIIVGPT